MKRQHVEISHWEKGSKAEVREVREVKAPTVQACLLGQSPHYAIVTREQHVIIFLTASKERANKTNHKYKKHITHSYQPHGDR